MDEKVLKGVDMFKGKTEDNHTNAFAVWKLLDDEGEYHRPSRLLWSSYTIEYAQFCQQPLSNAYLDIGAAVYSTLKLIPTIQKGQEIGDLLKSLGASTEEVHKHRLIPSPHHRFIRFRTSQCYPNTHRKVWGVLERLDDGVACSLYKSERESLRTEAYVVNSFSVGVLFNSYKKLEMDGLCVGVEELFRGIGGKWNGKYHLLRNNCIHYALECWKRLGGDAVWNGVVDGNYTVNVKCSPTAPKDSDCSLM